MPAVAACDASLRILTLRVLRADGTPETRAAVSVRRVRDGVLVLKRAALVEGGTYEIARDGGDAYELTDGSDAPPQRRPGLKLGQRAERFVVDVRIGRKVRRVPQTLGMDRNGCHVTRFSGADVITLP